jgi:dihydroneopterin aldolase/2-amino-4-hydroxy-6-hydroxymethyldihydropteridine diphosphokinase
VSTISLYNRVKLIKQKIRHQLELERVLRASVPKAFIGIGSNLGNRQEHCNNAVRLLEEGGISVLKRSTMIETEPWGVTEQPAFINMVIEIATDLNPDELLDLLKKTERAAGRTGTFRWGPRIMDLDILFYEDFVIKTPVLEIPHPRIGEREFVLRSLAEIAPDTVHPVLKKSVRTLLRELTG